MGNVGAGGTGLAGGVNKGKAGVGVTGNKLGSLQVRARAKVGKERGGAIWGPGGYTAGSQVCILRTVGPMG